MHRYSELDVTHKLSVDGCIVLNGKQYTSFEPAAEASSSFAVANETLEKISHLSSRVEEIGVSMHPEAFESRVRAVVSACMKTLPAVSSYAGDQATTRESLGKLASRVDQMDAGILMQKSVTSNMKDEIQRQHDRDVATFEPRVRAITQAMLEAFTFPLAPPSSSPPPPPPPSVPDAQLVKDIGALNEKISAMIRNSASTAKELANTRQLADRAQTEAKALREMLNAQDRRIAQLEGQCSLPTSTAEMST